MKLKRTKGIILKVYKTGETTKIITVYSKDDGKLSLVARGARRPLSKFVSVIDLGNFAEFVYYWKENRELYYISDASLLESYDSLKVNLSKFWMFNCLLELVNITTPFEEPNYRLFGLLRAGLDTLNKWELEKVRLLLYGFIMKLLRVQGLAPEMKKCVDCGSKLGNIRAYLNPSKGGFVCPRCVRMDKQATLIVGMDIRKLLQHFSRYSFERIKNLRLSFDQDLLLRKVVKSILAHYASDTLLKCKELL